MSQLLNHQKIDTVQVLERSTGTYECFVKRIRRRILEGLMMPLLPLIIVLMMKLSDAREYPEVLFTLNSPAEGASGKQFVFLKLTVK